MTTDTSKAPERIFARVHGASTDVISGKRGLLGVWNEYRREGQIEYVRADLFDAMQDRAEKAEAENERLLHEGKSERLVLKALKEGAEIERDALRAENERLRALIREGCDLLSVEVDALRAGISIGDEMRPGPEDQGTVAAINEMEGWIDRAGRAALERKEPTP